MYIRPHSYEMRPAAHGFSHEHHLYRYSEIWSDEGFVCIFAYSKNNCFAAIQLAATKLPPAAWILFSNPESDAKK